MLIYFDIMVVFDFLFKVDNAQYILISKVFWLANSLAPARVVID